MRVTDLRRETTADGARVCARFEWEDCDRPAREVYIEAAGPAAADLSPSADAFLLAGFAPAFHHGERRVFVDGAICPVLRDGIVAAMKLLRSWFEPERPLVAVEAAEIRAPEVPRARRAAMFLSGGLDSLFTLRKQMLEIPPGHPAAAREGLQIVGHDCPDPDGGLWSPRHHAAMRDSLRPVAEAAGVRLVPMRFNLRLLEPDTDFYVEEYAGVTIAAAAHAMAGRYASVIHSSSREFERTIPYSDHPLFDVCYSGSALLLRHNGMAYSRQQKLRLVAEWTPGLRTLRVCSSSPIPDGFLNCGVCEKCIRTRVGLLLLGRLDEATSFPPGEITPGMIATAGLFHGFAHFWHEFPTALRSIGRDDLSRAARRRLEQYFAHRAWVEERDWKGAVKRLDRRFLAGRLRRGWRAVRGRA